MKLDELREEIDRIDRKIIDLLIMRFSKVKNIAEIKAELEMEVDDGGREREIIENCINAAGEKLDRDFIENLMQVILSYSKKIQRRIR